MCSRPGLTGALTLLTLVPSWLACILDYICGGTLDGSRSGHKDDSAERTQYDPKNVGHGGSKWCDTGSNFRQNDLFSVESKIALYANADC